MPPSESSHVPLVEARRKHFTVEEANRSLPLVRAIVRDIVDQLQLVKDLHQRLFDLKTPSPRERPQDDPYAEELAQSKAELKSEEARLREYVEELEKLGIELKGPDGLCDFPSVIDDREIYLCWRPSEPEVQYWHELHTGFNGRQPLPPSAAAAPRTGSRRISS